MKDKNKAEYVPYPENVPKFVTLPKAADQPSKVNTVLGYGLIAGVVASIATTSVQLHNLKEDQAKLQGSIARIVDLEMKLVENDKHLSNDLANVNDLANLLDTELWKQGKLSIATRNKLDALIASLKNQKADNRALNTMWTGNPKGGKRP